MFANFELWSGGMVEHSTKASLPRSTSACIPCTFLDPCSQRNSPTANGANYVLPKAAAPRKNATRGGRLAGAVSDEVEASALGRGLHPRPPPPRAQMTD